MRAKPIFVIANQRSGTSVLRALVNKLENVLDFGEVFAPVRSRKPGGFLWFCKRHPDAYFDWSYKGRQRLFEMYLEHLNEVAIDKDATHFILDIKYDVLNQLDSYFYLDGEIPLLLRVIASLKQATVINITRKDHARQALSMLIARESRAFYFSGSISEDAASVHISIEDLASKSNQYQVNDKKYAGFLEKSKRYIGLIYEDMFLGDYLNESAGNKLSVAFDLQEDVSLHDIKLPFTKSPCYSKRITNYEEVSSFLDMR